LGAAARFFRPDYNGHVYRSALLVVLAAALSAGGCAETRYLLQAGPGQLELLTAGRDLEEVIADPEIAPRTRALLSEVIHIRRFAGLLGLETKGNYGRYVDLDRSAVVYFIAASRPLAFEARLWSFPIVGSFPYTGWFSHELALAERRRLMADGWDVYLRPVRAYSTGGWLPDPVLSTMLLATEDAFRYLAAVLLHELTHANFFVTDQATFNESLASFVGDQMTDDYLVTRFGADSLEVVAYRAELAEFRRRSALLIAVYKKLEALYATGATDAAKGRDKAKILRQLRIEADLWYQPNNASLIGFKTYNTGLAELATLFETCGRDWARFFALVGDIDADDFPSEQLEELGPFITQLNARGCPAEGKRTAEGRGSRSPRGSERR
jgi:predicted aminopeptidase